MGSKTNHTIRILLTVGYYTIITSYSEMPVSNNNITVQTAE